MRGRFAPSPTGALHVGNLRTALVAWLSARSQDGEWLVRMEDLDPVTSSPAHEHQQLADLAAVGLVPDGPVVRQSERFELHRQAIAELDGRGLVYPCYCTRREIRERSPLRMVTRCPTVRIPARAATWQTSIIDEWRARGGEPLFASAPTTSASL